MVSMGVRVRFRRDLIPQRESSMAGATLEREQNYEYSNQIGWPLEPPQHRSMLRKGHREFLNQQHISMTLFKIF